MFLVSNKVPITYQVKLGHQVTEFLTQFTEIVPEQAWRIGLVM